MKPESKAVIEKLINADFKSVMITGDNPLTSIHIGKECRIINEESPVFLLEKTSSIKNKEFSLIEIHASSIKEANELIFTKNSFINEFEKFKEKNKNPLFSFSLTG